MVRKPALRDLRNAPDLRYVGSRMLHRDGTVPERHAMVLECRVSVGLLPRGDLPHQQGGVFNDFVLLDGF